MKRAAILTILAVLPAACDDPSFPPQACLALQDTEMFIGEQETIALCFEDPDGDEVSVAATASDPGVVEAEVQPGGRAVLLTGKDAGQAVITVVARDSKGLSAQQTFLVTVPNRPPGATGQPDSLVISVGDSAMLIVSDHFEDPDGHELTYTAESNAVVVTVSVVGDTLTVHAADTGGTATVTIAATDGHDQAVLFLHVRVRPVREIVFEDDFETDDGGWEDYSLGGGQWEIEDGQLRMWSEAAGLAFAGAGRNVVAQDWVVEASVRGAKDTGVEMLIGWQNTEAGYFMVLFAVGDLVLRNHPRSHYSVAVVKDSENAIVKRGVLDDYDYLEHTTISAGLDDGELVLKVGETEVARFESQYVNFTMQELILYNRPPPGQAGSSVFVDWVRVTGIRLPDPTLDLPPSPSARIAMWWASNWMPFRKPSSR